MKQAGVHGAEAERAVLRLPAKFIADVALMRYATANTVLSQDVVVTGTPIDRLKQARAVGQGVVLGCANFGCF